MVQSINTKAILTLASIFRRPNLLVPHVSVASVSDVDYQALKEGAGICAVIFDKDNTLTSPYDTQSIHPRAQAGLKAALHVFGPQGVAILSNSAGTMGEDINFVQATTIEQAMGISVIRHQEKKPGGLDEVMEHFQPVLMGNNGNPARLCMIGDRILTDVVFGNLYGMLTVHTQPVTNLIPTSNIENTDQYEKHQDNQRKDNWTARLIRPIENYVVYGKLSQRLFWRSHKMTRPSSSSSPPPPDRAPKKHLYWPGEEACPLVLPNSTAQT